MLACTLQEERETVLRCALSLFFRSLHVWRRPIHFNVYRFYSRQNYSASQRGRNPLSDVSNLGFVDLTQKSVQNTTLSLVRACFHFFKVALVENVIAVSRVSIFHSSSRPIITALDEAVLTVSTHISNIPGYYGSVCFFVFF